MGSTRGFYHSLLAMCLAGLVPHVGAEVLGRSLTTEVKPRKSIGGNPFRPVGGWSAFHKDQRKRQAKAQAKRRRRAAR